METVLTDVGGCGWQNCELRSTIAVSRLNFIWFCFISVNLALSRLIIQSPRWNDTHLRIMSRFDRPFCAPGVLLHLVEPVSDARWKVAVVLGQIRRTPEQPQILTHDEPAWWIENEFLLAFCFVRCLCTWLHRNGVRRVWNWFSN